MDFGTCWRQTISWFSWWNVVGLGNMISSSARVRMISNKLNRNWTFNIIFYVKKFSSNDSYIIFLGGKCLSACWWLTWACLGWRRGLLLNRNRRLSWRRQSSFLFISISWLTSILNIVS